MDWMSNEKFRADRLQSGFAFSGLQVSLAVKGLKGRKLSCRARMLAGIAELQPPVSLQNRCKGQVEELRGRTTGEIVGGGIGLSK
jgi:hypothetical protein